MASIGVHQHVKASASSISAASWRRSLQAIALTVQPDRGLVVQMLVLSIAHLGQ